MLRNTQKKLHLEEVAIKARALALISITEGTNDLMEADKDALIWLLSDLVCELHHLIMEEGRNEK